jgi:hypothetical protein
MATSPGTERPFIPQRLDRAAGDLVVAAEEGVRRDAAVGEQRFDRLASPALRPAARETVASSAGSPASFNAARHPFLAQQHRFEMPWAGDVGDALAAKLGEVADRELRAAFVVGQQAKRVRIVDIGEHVDDGEAARGRDDRRALVGAPRGDDQSVDPLAEQLFDVPALAQRIVGRVAHEDGDAAIEQAPLERLDDRKGETAETVGRQDADRHRARAMQALGEIVRPIVERLGGARAPWPAFRR